MLKTFPIKDIPEPEPKYLKIFWGRIKKTKKCWNYIGPITKTKYGLMCIHARQYLAHRISYTWLVGTLPKDKVLDHLCRNTRCVNPKHLEVVTNAENTLRGTSPLAENKRKTHCSNGHPYSGDNLMTSHQGYRNCKACRYPRNEDYKKRNRAKILKYWKDYNSNRPNRIRRKKSTL